jgi:hypothetical protein
MPTTEGGSGSTSQAVARAAHPHRSSRSFFVALTPSIHAIRAISVWVVLATALGLLEPDLRIAAPRSARPPAPGLRDGHAGLDDQGLESIVGPILLQPPALHAWSRTPRPWGSAGPRLYYPSTSTRTPSSLTRAPPQQLRADRRRAGAPRPRRVVVELGSVRSPGRPDLLPDSAGAHGRPRPGHGESRRHLGVSGGRLIRMQLRQIVRHHPGSSCPCRSR